MLTRPCWRRNVSASHGVCLRSYGTALSNGLNYDLSRPVQSYISRSNDPFLNLSVEHYLLQKSSPDSAVLFLYVNRPSIILGRNQNPWFEVNLDLLKAGTNSGGSPKPQTEPQGLGDVDLVRRRSGGGTVFHDEGNVNWTVISPSSSFTRDKHAEMVVRALRRLGVSRSRVNERHDIVLDQGSSSSTGSWGPDCDTHSTPWQTDSPRSLKVSGSAYKLTRQRALHHGTALLNSPNLHIIPHYLRSPAKPFIKGRGVESVSSPVGNILLSNEDFIGEVLSEFGNLYGGDNGWAGYVGQEWLGIEGVEKGWTELKSPEWTYLQTPQFTLSNTLEEDKDDAWRESLPTVNMNVKNGLITELHLNIDDASEEQTKALGQHLDKLRVHEIQDWPMLFNNAGLRGAEAVDIAKWIQKMLPVAVEDEH